MEQDIPGFHYDPVRRRYFKILQAANNMNAITGKTIKDSAMERRRSEAYVNLSSKSTERCSTSRQSLYIPNNWRKGYSSCQYTFLNELGLVSSRLTKQGFTVTHIKQLRVPAPPVPSPDECRACKEQSCCITHNGPDILPGSTFLTQYKEEAFDGLQCLDSVICLTHPGVKSTALSVEVFESNEITPFRASYVEDPLHEKTFVLRRPQLSITKANGTGCCQLCSGGLECTCFHRPSGGDVQLQKALLASLTSGTSTVPLSQLEQFASLQDAFWNTRKRYCMGMPRDIACHWSGRVLHSIALAFERQTLVVSLVNLLVDGSYPMLYVPACHKDTSVLCVALGAKIVLAGHRDGRILVHGCCTRITARRGLIRTLSLRKFREDGSLRGTHSCVKMILLKSQEQVLAAYTSNEIILWDIGSRRILVSYSGHKSTFKNDASFAVEEDEDIVYIVGRDGFTTLWQLSTGLLLRSYPPPLPFKSGDTLPVVRYCDSWGRCYGNHGLLIAMKSKLFFYLSGRGLAYNLLPDGWHNSPEHRDDPNSRSVLPRLGKLLPMT